MQKPAKTEEKKRVSTLTKPLLPTERYLVFSKLPEAHLTYMLDISEISI